MFVGELFWMMMLLWLLLVMVILVKFFVRWAMLLCLFEKWVIFLGLKEWVLMVVILFCVLFFFILVVIIILFIWIMDFCRLRLRVVCLLVVIRMLGMVIVLYFR